MYLVTFPVIEVHGFQKKVQLLGLVAIKAPIGLRKSQSI